jgi:hypothetical protein
MFDGYFLLIGHPLFAGGVILIICLLFGACVWLLIVGYCFKRYLCPASGQDLIPEQQAAAEFLQVYSSPTMSTPVSASATYVIPDTTSQEPSAQATLISPVPSAGYATATAVATILND